MKHLKLFDSFLNEKEFSSEEREKLADKGFALPNGSYPIASVEDLKNAVSAFGRSNPDDRKEVAQHIAKRAKALGKEDLIPQTEIFQKALQESVFNESDETLNEGVVSIKGGRILAHKVLNKLVDMEVIPVKKKTEDLVETIASLLASASLNEAYEVHYSDGVRASKKFGNEKQAIEFAKELIASKKGLQFVDVFNAGSGFHSTADTDAIVAWWGDGSYTDNKSKSDAKLAAKKLDENEISESMTTYVFHVHPRDEHGDHIPSQHKVVKIKRADASSARDYLHKQYPNSKFFSELYSTE